MATMGWRTEAVGSSNEELSQRLAADIARAETVRALVQKMAPITKLTRLRVQQGNDGSVSMQLEPVDREPSRVASFVQRFRRWWANVCIVCGSPRARGLAFCGPECHTAWRVQDAERRGVGDLD